MSGLLDELIDRFDRLDEGEYEAVARDVIEATRDHTWVPLPGPQTEAYFSDADVLLYGGEAGGGKSDLLLGLAFTEHRRSLIMRRQYTDLSALTDRAKRVNGSDRGYSGAPPPKLRTSNGRLIDFGAARLPGQEQTWQGNPHDFLGVDEATQFAESQIRFLMGWLRSTDQDYPDQRTRVVLASNPPLSEAGDWVITMFAPWLDPAHSNPAEIGELRWYITDDAGLDQEVDGPGDYPVVDGDGNPVIDPKTGRQRIVGALSRTFIRAGVDDNPYIDASYRRNLDGLQEPLRSAIRDGIFGQARKDADLQLIPYTWVRAAQGRWTPEPPPDVPMCSLGVDVAGGGSDSTVLQPRYDSWFDEPIVEPGAKTPLGTDVAGLVIKHRRDNADVVIDCGGGYGNGPAEHLEINGVPVTRYKGAEGTTLRTLQGKMPFYNTRTAAYYRLFEALDPDQPGGSQVALPPDQELTSELCAVRLHADDMKEIRLEAKEKLVARLGRSPDKADAVVMAHWTGAKRATHHRVWHRQTAAPKVVRGRESARRRG